MGRTSEMFQNNFNRTELTRIGILLETNTWWTINQAGQVNVLRYEKRAILHVSTHRKTASLTVHPVLQESKLQKSSKLSFQKNILAFDLGEWLINDKFSLFVLVIYHT
jgi:hypothetical protein